MAVDIPFEDVLRIVRIHSFPIMRAELERLGAAFDDSEEPWRQLAGDREYRVLRTQEVTIGGVPGRLIAEVSRPSVRSGAAGSADATDHTDEPGLWVDGLVIGQPGSGTTDADSAADTAWLAAIEAVTERVSSLAKRVDEPSGDVIVYEGDRERVLLLANGPHNGPAAIVRGRPLTDRGRDRREPRSWDRQP